MNQREFVITFNAITETVRLVDASVKGLVRVCVIVKETEGPLRATP